MLQADSVSAAVEGEAAKEEDEARREEGATKNGTGDILVRSGDSACIRPTVRTNCDGVACEVFVLLLQEPATCQQLWFAALQV